MPHILGLDIGIASLGFALIEHNNNQGQILHMGVRIFPEAMEGKSEESKKPKNVARREARLRRRQLYRKRERRKQLRSLLAGAELRPDNSPDTWKYLDKNAADPYKLRTKALKEKLEPFELGRVLLHLHQRRGFRGSPKIALQDAVKKNKNTDEKDEYKISEEIEILDKKIGKSTLGAYLNTQEKKRGRHISRKQVVSEFDTIWEQQKNITLT